MQIEIEETAVELVVEGSGREVELVKEGRQNKKRLAKELRNKWKTYTNSKTNKKVPAKKIGKRCNKSCKKECSTISDEQRTEIFDIYYQLSDLRLQREFLVQHIK